MGSRPGPIYGDRRGHSGELVDEIGQLANEIGPTRNAREHHRDEELIDLRCCDLRFVVWFDESHPSAGCSAAEEAHNTDDLALRGKLLADVLVERIDCVSRVLRDERHPEGSRLDHRGTIAGRQRIGRFLITAGARQPFRFR